VRSSREVRLHAGRCRVGSGPSPDAVAMMGSSAEGRDSQRRSCGSSTALRQPQAAYERLSTARQRRIGDAANPVGVISAVGIMYTAAPKELLYRGSGHLFTHRQGRRRPPKPRLLEQATAELARCSRPCRRRSKSSHQRLRQRRAQAIAGICQAWEERKRTQARSAEPAAQGRYRPEPGLLLRAPPRCRDRPAQPPWPRLQFRLPRRPK